MALFDRLTVAARSIPTNDKAELRARDTMPRLVRKPWQRLQRAVKGLGDEPAREQLHAIRVLAKRLRYAAEAVVPAVGNKATAFAKSAAAIQEALGVLNDAAVATAWLLDVSESLGGRGGFAAGQLAQQIGNDASPNQEAWREAFSRMNRDSAWLY